MTSMILDGEDMVVLLSALIHGELDALAAGDRAVAERFHPVGHKVAEAIGLDYHDELRSIQREQIVMEFKAELGIPLDE